MLTQKFHWLVTGGAGFIGSHITKELVRLGQKVTVLDNLSGGTADNLRCVTDKITFINADIRDFSALADACKGIDYIFHEAALVSVAKSMENPQETAEINVQGTANLLEAARLNRVKRLIFTSSAAVYGTRPELPYTEDTPTDCRSPYAWSKQTATELCLLYTKIYHLSTVILRCFNVYGCGQNPHSAYAAVIAKFMQSATDGQPLEIDWDGLQSRDFINVADVVQANLLAALKAPAGEIYNVASGETHTLAELADMIEKISGKKLPRVSRPKRAGDVHESSADISKIRALGFTPSVKLADGLKEMWIRKNAK